MKKKYVYFLSNQERKPTNKSSHHQQHHNKNFKNLLPPRKLNILENQTLNKHKTNFTQIQVTRNNEMLPICVSNSHTTLRQQKTHQTILIPKRRKTFKKSIGLLNSHYTLG